MISVEDMAAVLDSIDREDGSIRAASSTANPPLADLYYLNSYQIMDFARAIEHIALQHTMAGAEKQAPA